MSDTVEVISVIENSEYRELTDELEVLQIG